MGEIMNPPRRVKSCVPGRVSISCPTCGTSHDSGITGNQSYVTVGEQIIQHMLYLHVSVKFVNKVCMTI